MRGVARSGSRSSASRCEDRRLGEGDGRDPVRRRPVSPAHGLRQAPPLPASPRADPAHRHGPRPGAAGVYGVPDWPRSPRVKFGILPVSQDEEALCTEKVRMVGDAVAAWRRSTRNGGAGHRADRRRVRGAAAAHVDRGRLGRPRSGSTSTATAPTSTGRLARFGDVESAFARADLVREDVFYFEGNTHLPMEQHCALALWGPDGKLTLWSSTQTPHYVHRLLGRILDVPARTSGSSRRRTAAASAASSTPSPTRSPRASSRR